MRGKWLLLVRRAHLFLGVFFSPLLLFFIVTGWWQVMTTDDEKEADGGMLHELMKKLSTVHTDGHFPGPGKHPHDWVMKLYIVAMCVALILSIVLGMVLAWQMMRNKWSVGLAFFLGIAVPVVVLYLV